MNTSGLTGLLLCAAAVLWVAFLVPTWSKSASRNQVIRDQRQQAISQLKKPKAPANSQLQLARQAVRLKRTQAFFGFSMIAALAALGFGVFAGVWEAIGGGLVVFGLSVTVNRTAKKRYQGVLASYQQHQARRPQSYAMETLVSAAVEVAAIAEVEDDDREWTPAVMPAPLHTAHIGSLEEPILAQVTELSVARVAEVNPTDAVIGANLDEILRRRRAI